MATVEDFARTLMLDKNLILEGPPGTGKTFAIKEICSELTKNGHTLLGNGNGKFATTLHPITSYEDFVEGLRPNTDTMENSVAPTMIIPIDGRFPGTGLRFHTVQDDNNYYSLSIHGKKANEFKMTKLTKELNLVGSDFSAGSKVLGLFKGGTGGNASKLHIVKRLRPPKSSSHLEKRAPSIRYTDPIKTNYEKEDLKNSTISDDKITWQGVASGSGNLEVTVAGTDFFQVNNNRWYLLSFSSTHGKYTINVESASLAEEYYNRAYDSSGAPKSGFTDLKSLKDLWADNSTEVRLTQTVTAWVESADGQGGAALSISKEDPCILTHIASNSTYLLNGGEKNRMEKKKLQWDGFNKLGVDPFLLIEQNNQNLLQSGDRKQFVVKNGFFLNCCKVALQNPQSSFVVLLDEINRCNVPKVLGDLLTTVENSKRLPWNEELAAWDYRSSGIVTLPYSERLFSVPENVYIVGTMNTTDRSVAPIDAALRRRFSFLRISPMKSRDLLSVLQNYSKNNEHDHLEKSIEAWGDLNKALNSVLGADAMLGHSYFFDALSSIRENICEPEIVVSDLWRMSLLPQLADLLDSTGDANNLYNEIIKKEDAWREFGWDLDFGIGNFSNPYQRTTVKSRSPSSLLHNEESELSDESE